MAMTQEFVFTPQMQKTLRLIESFSAEHGRDPCGSEIAEALGKSEQAVHQHLRRLIDNGLVYRRAATSSKMRPMWHYRLTVQGKKWL